MKGQVGILNVGAGDIKLSFDKSNPMERARAARIVEDMIRRGYVLFIDEGNGTFKRVHEFDEDRCEYIVADMDPDAATKEDTKENGNGQGETEEATEATSDPEDGKESRRRGRPKGSGRRAVSANSTRAAIAVPRTAGG